MQNLAGKSVKILSGDLAGAAGYCRGHDENGFYLVDVVGVVNGENVDTTIAIEPLQVEVL